MNKTIFLILALLKGAPLAAYVGPGAGIVIGGVSGIFLGVIVIVIFTVFILPFTLVFKKIFHLKRKPMKDKVVIIGFDGLDPKLVNQFIGEGLLPNIKKLHIQPLATTNPALSPVAWSSFLTGVNPGKHNIFDFLSRDSATQTVGLSLARNDGHEHYSLRKSRSVIDVLGQYRVPCFSLRVPGTFPPEACGHGGVLAGFPVPDILGTQGTYHLLTEQEIPRPLSGMIRKVSVNKGMFQTMLNGLRALTCPLAGRVDYDQETVRLEISGRTVLLEKNVYSDWLVCEFNPGDVTAITRMLLLSVKPLRIYCMPLNLDPARSTVPVSSPPIFSRYLAEKLGSLAPGTTGFATLGMAEDMQARRDGVIDVAAFIRQCYLLQQERERIYFDCMERFDEGVMMCVFEFTDRLQHMCLHHEPTIRDMYRYVDELVGRIRAGLGDPAGPGAKTDDHWLMIVSDHGINRYERGVNLNTFLVQHGYLTYDDPSAELTAGIAWKTTRAYAFGFTGIYLNEPGTEERVSLRQEIRNKLLDLRDPVSGRCPFKNVYLPEEIYSGPYVDHAPDLVIGYDAGYRSSFASARGLIDPDIFQDNTSPWHGDHSIDASLVPGVCLSNIPLSANPSIMDIAPTILTTMGIPVPKHMDGRNIMDMK